MNANTPPLRRLTWRRQLLISHLWFALNLLSSALLPIVVPTQILLFVAPGHVGNAQQVTFLAWLSALGAIIALLIPPLVGMLSDHTPGPLGRRRPYIIAGAIVILLDAFPLIKANGIIILILCLGFLLVGINIITAGYQGLIPDQVPHGQRGAASGYMGFMTILGNVGSLALAAWLFSQVNLHTTGTSLIHNGAVVYYTSTIAILLIGVLITTLGVREKPFSTQHITLVEAESEIHNWFVHNWVRPWHSRNFTVVFLTRFAMMMGLALFMTFIEYYLANVAHVTNFVQATATIAVLALLGAVFSALLLGIFSDYVVKRAPLISLATAFMSLAAFAFVVFPGGFPLWPLGVLFGLGYGAYMSVDWALAVDVLPSTETAGKDLGLWNASSTLPTAIAPLLGSLIIILLETHGSTALGYRLVFATATFFLMLAAIGVLFVREHKKDIPAIEPGKRRFNIGWYLAFRTRAGRARGFLRFWLFYERLTRSLWRLQLVPHAPHHLLEIRIIHYRGPVIDLPDGTHVGKGDPIIELHFRNQALLEVEEQASAWRYIQLSAQSLNALACWMQEPDFPGDARAIHGTTLLYRGAARLGFMLRERPRNVHTYLERFFMTGLMVLYHRQGSARLLQGTTYGAYPQEVWMSRQELFKRYGNSCSSPSGGR